MTAPPLTQGRLVPGLIRAARPRQWTKNVLVLAAPLAGGVILQSAIAASVAVAFLAFCLSASGVYLVNDALDVDADRAHPRKQHRPVASGVVPVSTALVVGAALLLAGLVTSSLVSPRLILVVLVYEVLQVSYCLWLKHEAVLDIAVVASGFLLRAIAGAVAADVVPSQWFLLVAAFGSLFMVAGKRYAEMVLEGRNDATRRALGSYTSSYLRFVWSLAATVVVVTYCLWAFEIAGDAAGWATVSIAPFVLAILRYAVDVDAGAAGEPEEIVVGDRVLQALGALWLTALSLAVYYR